MTFRLALLQDEVERELDKQHEIEERYVGYDGNDEQFFHQQGYKALQKTSDSAINANSGDGDERNFLAIKPWVGTLVPPSKYRIPIKNGTKGEYEPVFTEENNNWNPPEIDLDLDYAFGYRARDCRNNIHQIDDHQVLYHCAALGVIKNLETSDEDFYQGHTGDVLCMDYHEATGLVCSGSSAANYEAQLCVWDSKTPSKMIHNIKGFHKYAVVSCAFNPQGTMILSIGLDEHHSVALHCTITGILLACSQADKSRVVYGKFMQCHRSKSETTFVTVGTKHVKFWGPVEESDKMTSYVDYDFAEKAPSCPSSEAGGDSGYKPNTYMISQNPEENRLVAISGSKCKEISRICLLSIEFTKTHVLVGASNGHIYAFHAATKECEASFFVTSERILSMTYVGPTPYGPRDGHKHAVAVGTGSGMIYFYTINYGNIEGDPTLAKALSFDPDIAYGGGSGKINVNLFNEATKDMNPNDPEAAGQTSTSYPASIRALNYSPITKRLLVGTILNHIYRLDPLQANKSTPETIVNGHWGCLDDPCGYGELWGIAASPNSHHVVTACEDGMVRKWELVQSVEEAKFYIGEPAISVSWSLNNEFIAVGLRDGGFVVLSSELKKIIHRSPSKKGKVRVQDIQFSPSTEYLAIGVEQCIEVYMCYDGVHPRTGNQVPAWSKIGECRGHSSLVTAFDWNIDSRLIQCSSNSYEVLFYDIPTCERLVGEFLADQVWYTQTCPIGWSVQGIWPRYADGSDINCVAKSRSEQWVITGDDWSQMKMFNYPCIGSGTNRRTGQVEIKPQHKLFTGHASHVTGCVWTYDDSYVCTLGGRDMTILSWKVLYNDVERKRHILDAELIRQRMANHEADNSRANNTAAFCYMCNYEYVDDVAEQCPICNAIRVVHTKDHKRAWINLTESSHRLPTSAFAEHVKLQIRMRKELQAKKSLPQMSNAPLIYKPPENEASCTDSDDDDGEGTQGIQNLNRSESGGYVASSRRKLAPTLGTTRSGTQVTTSNVVPKMKKVVKGKKTSGPDYRDY